MREDYSILDAAKKRLEDLKFSEYKVSEAERQKGVVANCTFKRTDKIGKKYFVIAKIYDMRDVPNMNVNYSIEYSTQLYMEGSHAPFNITFVDSTFENAVMFIEDMFNDSLLDYYEVYDD